MAPSSPLMVCQELSMWKGTFWEAAGPSSGKPGLPHSYPGQQLRKQKHMCSVGTMEWLLWLHGDCYWWASPCSGHEVLAMGSLPGEGTTVTKEVGQCVKKQASSKLFNSLEIPQPVIVHAYPMDLVGWSWDCQKKELQRRSCKKRWWEILLEQNCEQLGKRLWFLYKWFYCTRSMVRIGLVGLATFPRGRNDAEGTGSALVMCTGTDW